MLFSILSVISDCLLNLGNAQAEVLVSFLSEFDAKQFHWYQSHTFETSSQPLYDVFLLEKLLYLCVYIS